MVEENFKNFDNFKKGFLDMDDFGCMLKKNTGKFFSEKEVKDLLIIADKNHDKTIDKKELKAFFKTLINEFNHLHKQ
jgi:Ca2+-binding EF-hand superfamily protein